MTDNSPGRLALKLRALFNVIIEEAGANPRFARKIDAALSQAVQEAIRPEADVLLQARQGTVLSEKKTQHDPHPMLHNVTFDPLECHIEAAILNGREQEARAFLGRLDRTQLEEVVKVQRLPGAKNLQKTILEAVDAASAVDAIVGSASEKLRYRYSAAR
jgi:hypothetical protein